MSVEEERDLLLKRTTGGLESLDDKDRERVAQVRDPQMDRAVDLLKGIMLFTERAPAPEKKAKGEKMAAASAK
jgi:hypothetical protein